MSSKHHQFQLHLVVLVAATILLTSITAAQARKLVQVFELCRHGARSPFYRNLDYPAAWGDMPLVYLTPIGMRQHYLIGRSLRKQLIERERLISNFYDPDEVFIYDTSESRAIMSAESQMVGLFFESGQNLSSSWRFQRSTDLPPLQIDPLWGEELLRDLGRRNLPASYQPVALTAPSEQDLSLILQPTNQCPKISALRDANELSDVSLQFTAQLEEDGFFAKFRATFGIPDSQPVDITLVGQYYDTLNCDYYQQIPFQANLTYEFYEQIGFVYDFRNIYYRNYGATLLKLQNANLLRVIRDQIRNPGSRKLTVFSASDGNVNALNMLFGIVTYTTDYDVWRANRKRHTNAPFASTIFIEIYKESQRDTGSASSGYSVRYVYNGEAQQIWGACSEEYCDLDVFLNFINLSALSVE